MELEGKKRGFIELFPPLLFTPFHRNSSLPPPFYFALHLSGILSFCPVFSSSLHLSASASNFAGFSNGCEIVLFGPIVLVHVVYVERGKYKKYSKKSRKPPFFYFGGSLGSLSVGRRRPATISLFFFFLLLFHWHSRRTLLHYNSSLSLSPLPPPLVQVGTPHDSV